MVICSMLVDFSATYQVCEFNLCKAHYYFNRFDKVFVVRFQPVQIETRFHRNTNRPT